jgi:hypothetical protein
MSRVDPSGHADCAAGDNTCWQSEWSWKNRWYEAHGYFWDNGGWSRYGLANFRDEGILRETVGEAGVTFDNTVFGAWDFANGQMQLIGQGVVALANKLGGLAGFAHLKTLLGGGASFERYNLPGRSHAGGAQLAYGEVWPHTIRVFNDFFVGGAAIGRGNAVHELAHVIDYNSSKGYMWLSSHVPNGLDEKSYIGSYGADSRA